jgi:hypothetical protein
VLHDQVVVDEDFQQAGGGTRAGVGEGCRGVGVDVGAGKQSEVMEKALVGRAEVLVGEVEDSGQIAVTVEERAKAPC